MIQNIELEKIHDNPFNPRTNYNRDKIAELASSIKQLGLIQIPQARAVPGGFYEMAYGGYRKRAYQLLATKEKQFDEMPLDIKPITDDEMALFGLEENLKRDDITPLDTARAIDTYLAKFTGTTEKQLAVKLTIAQPSISNMRRVLRLPAKILEKVNEGKINFSMARELCPLQGLKPTRRKYGSALEESNQTDEYMMLEAIRSVTRQYGNCTVNGIKKAIYDEISSTFPCLNLREGYHWQETLFDWRKAGCLKCEKVVKANATKSQVNSFCTDTDCWDKKQQEHKDQAAKQAKERMTKDLALRVLEDQKKIASQASSGGIPQGISSEEKEYRFFLKKGTGVKSTKATSPQQALEKLEVKPEDGVLKVQTAKGGWSKVEAIPGAELIHAIHTNDAEALLTDEERKSLADAQAQQVAADLSQEAEEAQRRRRQLGDIPNYPCHTCINIGKCDGTHVEGTDDKDEPGYPYKCDWKLVTAAEKVTAKATIEMPSGLLDKVKDTAGTRAQILDLYQLRAGSYNFELVHGHQRLDGILRQMADPQECLERCTHGFHYAFDSKEPNGTYYVCTDPKCCSQKKAEFTRAKNARAMLRKKAEAEAIRTVVKATDKMLDIPRVKLIFMSSMMGAHVPDYYSPNSANLGQEWLIKRLKVDTDKLRNEHSESLKKKAALLIMAAIDKLPFQEMCQLLVEFMFEQLRYDGELAHYEIQTTEALALFHVGIQVPKESEEPDNRSNPAMQDNHVIHDNCAGAPGFETDLPTEAEIDEAEKAAAAETEGK